MKKGTVAILGIVAGVVLACGVVRADDVVTTRTVKFGIGKASAVLKGSVKGYNSVRYEITAKAGQTLSANLKSKSLSLYFNVLNKHSDVALETEPIPREVTHWKGKLPETGIYVVQVYLVRSAARQGKSANFSLNVFVTGVAEKPAQP